MPVGGVAEWSNAPVLKTDGRESVPRVRIPVPPPNPNASKHYWMTIMVFSLIVFLLTSLRYPLYSFSAWYEVWYFLNGDLWKTYKKAG